MSKIDILEYYFGLGGGIPPYRAKTPWLTANRAIGYPLLAFWVKELFTIFKVLLIINFIPKMLFEKIFGVLPHSLIYFLGSIFGHLAYLFMGKRKKIAQANLDLIFQGRLTKKEKRHILKQNLKKICVGFLELIRCLHLPHCNKYIKIKGERHLKEVFNKKNGVAIVGAHIGNFPLMCVFLAQRGYPIAVIAKDPHSPILARFIQRIKRKSEITFIDATDIHAPRLALKWLKQGGILYLQLDQNAPKHKAMIDFFGHSVPTYKSPVVLSQKTGAAVLPMFIVSESNHQIIYIEKPFTLKNAGKKDQDIYENLTSLMKVIESYVRRYPTQWWWWHRRFKEHIDYERL